MIDWMLNSKRLSCICNYSPIGARLCCLKLLSINRKTVNPVPRITVHPSVFAI